MRQAPSVIVLAMDFSVAQNVTINQEPVNPKNMREGAIMTYPDGNQAVFLMDNKTLNCPHFKESLKSISNEIHTIPTGTKSTDIQTFPSAQLAYIATPRNV